MLEIRPARAAEFPAVADVCEAAYAPYLQPNGHYRAVLRDVARRASAAELLVATEDGRVLGTVTLVADGGPLGEIAGPDEAEFRMLAVDPAAQGRGVGAALLRRVVDETRARGKARIVCSSLPEMRAAHRVYERAGFRRAPARDWSPVDDVRLLAFVYSAEASPRSAPLHSRAMYHVRRAAEIAFEVPAAYAENSSGHRRAEIVGQAVGALHTGITQCTLDPGGTVGEHLHSFEKSFYVLEGGPRLTIDGRTWQLSADDCGLVPLGVPHAWRNAEDGEPSRWIEASAPAPRPPDHPSPDTFFTGTPAPDDEPGTLDIRDPRARTFFRLEPGQMDLDNLRIGAPVDAPTVSASMATALLAYSGIALKMLVDSRLGAVLHQMFMVDYEPGGAAQLHDHPLEESYTIISGEVDAEADGERFTLRAGDVFWSGVGCVHGFWNTSGGRVRFLETQSPQLPANHSYRFNRDWDYLTERLRRGA